MKKTTLKTMPEDFRTGDGRTVHSWTGKIFGRFSFMEGARHESKEANHGTLDIGAERRLKENRSWVKYGRQIFLAIFG